MKADPNLVILGEYEIHDAKRLIDALEKAQIPFDLEEVDIPEQLLGLGSFGQLSRLKVWISESDRAKAQSVQSACLRIES